jgi:hypothetical protein
MLADSTDVLRLGTYAGNTGRDGSLLTAQCPLLAPIAFTPRLLELSFEAGCLLDHSGFDGVVVVVVADDGVLTVHEPK